MRGKFADLIKDLDPTLSVLDVGAGGQGGLNTSDALVHHFKDYTGINPDVYGIRPWILKHPGVRIIPEDFYTYDFQRKFDLIVLDLGAEQNQKDWTEGLIEGYAKTLLKPRGSIITYVNFDEFKSYELKDVLHEVRREEMVWVRLQRYE